MADFNQIQFPTTQVPSTDPNTLDDYEEVSWTPTVSAAVGTMALNSYTATAVKVGRLVVFNVVLNVTTTGVLASTITIGGLPYTSAATALSFMRMTFNNYSTSIKDDGYTYVNASSTNAIWSNKSVALIDTTFFMHFSGYYLAAA